MRCHSFKHIHSTTTNLRNDCGSNLPAGISCWPRIFGRPRPIGLGMIIGGWLRGAAGAAATGCGSATGACAGGGASFSLEFPELDM